MLMFPTENLFIEGPDCSGKTTLVNNIHKLTRYKWHIHDRSQVSRKIFKQMYNRDLPYSQDNFHEEVFNLNNRFVFLLPQFEIIRERFKNRGDDIHKSIDEIKSVYDRFEKEFSLISKLPNALPYPGVATPKAVEAICTTFDLIERAMLKEVSDQVLSAVSHCGSECMPLKFTLYDSGDFQEATVKSMDYEPEKKYYEKIYKTFHEKISNELSGNNEYNRIESSNSRRFVYTDDSCISFIQLSIRNKKMDFHVVIRSSDVENIFPHDLKFLYYLASTCYERFQDELTGARLRFNLNSAHIIS